MKYRQEQDGRKLDASTAIQMKRQMVTMRKKQMSNKEIAQILDFRVEVKKPNHKVYKFWLAHSVFLGGILSRLALFFYLMTGSNTEVILFCYYGNCK
jgi:hypothetical protein